MKAQVIRAIYAGKATLFKSHPLSRKKLIFEPTLHSQLSLPRRIVLSDVVHDSGLAA